MNNLRDIRTLLIDDSRPMRILVREVMSALGLCICNEAASAEDAMAILREFRPDLIITDYMLGGEDGISFVKRIRQNPARDEWSARVPIIMMSGHGQRSVVQAAISAGATTFLVKPVSARSIAEHIAYALSERTSVTPPASYFGLDSVQV
jgi:CheY-like chemotaxis protein